MSSDTSYGKERNTNLDPRAQNPLQILNGIEVALEDSDGYSEVVLEFERYKQESFGKENNCTVEDERLFKALINEYNVLDIDTVEKEAVEAYDEVVSEISSNYEDWGQELANELNNLYEDQRARIRSQVAEDSGSEGAEIL
jgi:hypothetical protein